MAHIFEYADVYHCDNLDKVADEFIAETNMAPGSFDNVGEAHYAVPDHWDMGHIYCRLAMGIARARGLSPVQALAEAYHSPIAPLIDDYNASFYYENPDNILLAHLEGIIE